jgi:hypothetical protein
MQSRAPNDFDNMEEIAEGLNAFEDRYNTVANHSSLATTSCRRQPMPGRDLSSHCPWTSAAVAKIRRHFLRALRVHDVVRLMFAI